MADTQTVAAATPKEIGKQLRAVRRRKGLSLSEVARGAGLSRRELVAYERGKTPIPDSDLWVLAGSCGVDVSELVPAVGPRELEAGPSSIGDTIEFLRRGQANGNARPVRALEAAPVYSAPAPVPSPEAPPESVDDFAAEPPVDSAAPWTPAPAPAAPVDVFEELARLPEPIPLKADADQFPDLLTPQSLAGQHPAFRDDGPPPESFDLGADGPPPESFELGADGPPPGTFELGSDGPPPGTFELVDDAPFVDDAAPFADVPFADAAFADAADDMISVDAHPIDVAARDEWIVEPAAVPDEHEWPEPPSQSWGVWYEPEPGGDTPAGTPGVFDDALLDDAAVVPVISESLDAAAEPWTTDSHTLEPWAHEPDPEATNSGFLVDWGEPGESAATAPSWEPATIEAGEEFAARREPSAWEPVRLPAWDTPLESEPEVHVAPEPERAADAPVISWHATVAEPRPEEWVVADDDWELGNALPLVEVRGQGALVMRRADERWALASLNASDHFVLEVDLELRSGPGFGVLFRASVDDEGRMSAYSFDVDPVYEGGGYLVRQWQGDRELWNPIAHVPAADPASMYGTLTVRLEMEHEHLTAWVKGVAVMTVESLKQASVDRGRDAASGHRVGVQAWSSSDLVVETLRVADR